MIIVPIQSAVSSRWQMDMELDGDVYSLRFSYNAREAAWYLDILSDGTELLCGVKLVIGYRLLRQYRAIPGLPNGDFFVQDNEPESQAGRIDFDNLGNRYMLVFATYTELGE